MHEEGSHTQPKGKMERIVGGRLGSRMRKAREQGRRLRQTSEDEEEDRRMQRTKV